MSVRVSISRTVSNVDTNTDFSLVNVVTVALYCSGSVVIFTTVSDPNYNFNRHGTTALSAIKRDEPALTAATTSTQQDIALVNNAKGCVISHLVEDTVLQIKGNIFPLTKLETKGVFYITVILILI